MNIAKGVFNNDVEREWCIKAQEFSLHYQINPNKKPFVVAEASAAFITF